MNTSFYIAKRYLLAKKSTNAINIISGISVVGVLVGSAALIIILSVFNGFEGVVLKMFNTFSPQILITPVSGKSFNPNTAYFKDLKNQLEVYSFTEVLSENAVLKYRDRQAVGVVKGVSSDFLKNRALDSITIAGKFILENSSNSWAVIGSALQSYLMLSTNDPFTPMQLFSPNKGSKLNSINPSDDITMLSIPVAGIYEVQEDFDNQAIVPLSIARKLFNEKEYVSSIEINLKKGISPAKFIEKLRINLGSGFEVKGRIEQNKALFNVLGSEKWMVYLILSFILIIAIFNIIGSLTMLVIEKTQDILILSSLGASKNLIKKIFLFEGMMITLTGCFAGLILGGFFCFFQQKWGLIKMGVAKDPYPIGLKSMDFLLVFITVFVFSLIASILASNLSIKYTSKLNRIE